MPLSARRFSTTAWISSGLLVVCSMIWMKPMVPPGLGVPASQLPDADGVHPSELLLELVDLVAQAGGELEVQLAGGVVHLVRELLDQGREVRPRHAGQVLGVPAGARA